jgi:hypothetical protein
MCNNVSEPLDRACAGRVLRERNVNSHLIIIGTVLRKNSPKVFLAEHDQMISALTANGLTVPLIMQMTTDEVIE